MVLFSFKKVAYLGLVPLGDLIFFLFWLGILPGSFVRDCLGIRHFQVFLLWIGVISSSGIRPEMSIAIVAMTDSNLTSQNINWTLSEQSYILSAPKWGYIVTIFPAGVMTNYIGGILLLKISTLIHSITLLLIPVTAMNVGWPVMCTLCAIQGFAMGLVLPAVISILANWVPVKETSRLVGFVYSGGPLGTAVAMLFSGAIAQKWRWQIIFYMHGMFALVITIVYAVFVSNSPESSKLISDKEKLYIERSLQHVTFGVKRKIPWNSILTCLPVWSLVMSTTGFNWGFNVLITAVPTYTTYILNAALEENGWLSAIPYLLLCAMCYVFGIGSDYILGKKWLSINACRKTSNAIATFIPALFLICLTFIPKNKTLFVVILSIGMALCAGYYTGDGLMYLDMAPNFASPVHSLVQLVADCISLFAPIVTGAIVKDPKNSHEWNKVFLLTAAIYIVTNTFFLVFANAKEQPWNNLEENIEHNHEKNSTLVDKTRNLMNLVKNIAYNHKKGSTLVEKSGNLMNPVENIEHKQDEN